MGSCLLRILLSPRALCSSIPRSHTAVPSFAFPALLLSLFANRSSVWLIEFLRLRQIELQAKNEFVEYDATVTSDMEDVNEVLPGLWKYGALIPGLGLVTQVPAQSKKDVPEPGEAIRLRLENAQPVRRMLRWNRVRQA